MTPDNTTTVEQVISALDRLGCHPKSTGANRWQARCPAHDDDSPSLSVAAGDKRPVILKCFAGCAFKDIMSALGLTGAPRPPHLKLVSDAKPKYPPARLPSGRDVETIYFYPDGNGADYMAVVRRVDENGKKSFSQRTHHDGDLWAYGPPELRPLYRLPELLESTGRVAVVEGEKCADAVARAWPGQTVTTPSGGTGGWEKTDWTPLQGRPVSILSDADKTGRKFARAIAAHLSTLGCSVRIGLAKGETKNDIADWLESDGPVATAARVAAMLVDYVPPADKKDASTEPEVADTDALVTNPHYRVLGFVDDHIAVRISAGRILRRSREAMCGANTLIALAPTRFWHRLGSIDQLTSSAARLLGDALLRAADNLGAIDMTHIYGRGAVRLDDGTVAWHLGDRIMINGDEAPLDNRERIWLAEPKIELAPSAAQAEVDAAREAILAYRFLTPGDAQRFLGWIPAAVAGGALEWRPHAILTGPAATGKSWLLRQVLERLIGPIMSRIADGTTAAIARITQMSSLPIAIDEAEPTGRWVIELMKMLRVASGGEGLRLRADVGSGGVVSQAPRFAALLSAIAVPAMDLADASRISLIRLGQEVGNWPEVAGAIEAAMAAAPGIRAKMIRDTPAIAAEAASITRHLQAEGGTNSREALSAGAFTAGWAWWHGEAGDDTIVWPMSSAGSGVVGRRECGPRNLGDSIQKQPEPRRIGRRSDEGRQRRKAGRRPAGHPVRHRRRIADLTRSPRVEKGPRTDAAGTDGSQGPAAPDRRRRRNRPPAPLRRSPQASGRHRR